jgi:PAS domain S-box-containing protein
VNRRLQDELLKRERLQQAMAESLALLDTLQKHAPIGIAFMDRNYRFQRVNDELAAINGLPASAHLGRTVAEVVPAIWPKLEPVYRKVLAGEPALNVEISGETLAHVGVERHWVASYYPVRNPSHEVIGLGVFVSEVTERKKAEIALREQATALAETARQKDEFIAMLSHELRNPLAPVRSALELLRRFGPQNAIAASTFDVMERQIKHMVRLLDDLLDVSRITSGRIRLNMQLIDVRQVIGDGIESARSLIDRRRHRLETVLPPEPVFVRGDATRLVQVLVNLLNNAAKYTPEGGTIRLAASAEDADAVLRVADTGAGISPRLLPKIFDLFTQDDRTLDRAQGGLGIGLTLVRRISELHGGTVEVHSPGRGQGSEFVVRLPRVVPDAVIAALPSANVTAPSTRTPKRCLLVEDNVDAAQMLQIALELEGHKVCLAFDGDQAIAMATTFQPDAVILDLGLPGLNGYDAARAIRLVPGLENVLLIAATGYGQQGDRERSRAAGFDHHLVKPIDLDMLIATLAAGRTAAIEGL